MQGSGNAQSWQRGLNAQLGASLKMPFYLSAAQIIDEAGNIRIDALTIDYDIDPFRSDVGTAATDLHDHSLTPGATSSHKHDPSDTGHPHGNATQSSTNTTLVYNEGNDTDTSYSASVGWNTDAVSEAFAARAWSFLMVKVVVICKFSNSDFDVAVRIHNGTSYHVNRYNMNADTS